MIKGVIFDMDGVIVDSRPHHIQAWKDFCDLHGITIFNEEFYNRISGNSTEYFLKTLLGKRLSPEEIIRYSEEKDQLYLRTYGKSVFPTEGLIDFLEELLKHSVVMAVATSEPFTTADFILNKTNTVGYFETIVYGTAVRNPKPHPEIYLKAAEAIKVKPNKCAAIEDSVPGIRSAKAAGMNVVGITTSLGEQELKAVGADLVINDFRNCYAEISKLENVSGGEQKKP